MKTPTLFRPAQRGQNQPAALLLDRARLRRRLGQFTAGGRWTDHLAPEMRRNLRWFWLDGILAQASDSIVLAYLSIFALALGASRTQIGLMSALSSLSAALLLLPGAAAVEHWGQRKRFCLLSGGGAARLMILLMVFVPLLGSTPVTVYALIALAVARNAFANLSVPAWTSLTADIVPLTWRGRYFSSRSTAMGIASMVITYLAGQLITRSGEPLGYQLALALAFGLGLVASFSFARLDEPPMVMPPPHHSTTSLLAQLRTHPEFLAYCAVAALWNLALGIASPFFGVYLAETLRASAAVVGGISVVSGLSALPGLRLFGHAADRWGPRRVQLLTGLLIPLVPVGWALARSPWHLVPFELAAGFLWAGHGLASFNFLLQLTPEERRARFSALYQIVVTVGLAAGAALGGLIAARWEYRTTFFVSSAGRMAAALLFLILMHRPTPGESAEDRAATRQA